MVSRAGDDGLDEVRARLGQCPVQLLGEFRGRGRPAGRYAHAAGQGGEIKAGPGNTPGVTNALACGRSGPTSEWAGDLPRASVTLGSSEITVTSGLVG